MFCLRTKVWWRKGGGGLQCCGTTFVMLNPILNLPVLIGHHKHPFTKGLWGNWGLRGGRQHKALPNGRHWIKPKPARLSLRRTENRKSRIMLCLSSTVSTRHKHKGEHNRQSKTELKKKKREKARNEPSCLHFGSDIWQLPFKSECLQGPIGDGSSIPCSVIKSGF